MATVFLDRCLEFNLNAGKTSVVLPQNWLFLTGYRKFREKLLSEKLWNSVVKLGASAFETISGEVVKALLISLTKESLVEHKSNNIIAIDASKNNNVEQKSRELLSGKLLSILQSTQLQNPDSRVMFTSEGTGMLLNKYAYSHHGLTTGDTFRMKFSFWEVKDRGDIWIPFQGTVTKPLHFGGKETLLRWENGRGSIDELLGARKDGTDAWSRPGVVISQMGALHSTIYLGTAFDNNTAVLTANNSDELPAIFAFCQSPVFNLLVRELDQKMSVTSATLGKVNFDINHWSKIAEEKHPNGLPKPYSNDPTQWIFHGHPCASVVWGEEAKNTTINELRQGDTVLQVAVARLLGYRWPSELDTEMELAPDMREVIAQNSVFDGLVDDDGIVCIPAIRGEKPAVDRLEAVLHAAYGDKWSATVLNNLLKSVKSRDLNIWLRDKFFEQHCKLFQHRPFIWHIWDGLPDGFSALVNYHQLDYKGLERLIYTYLDDWISTQIQLEKDGDEGAEIRLAAARNLRKQLEEILVGDSLPGQGGLDIFVRWKPLAEQPIGWNPDLNDGVRLNIRPFMKAKDVGKKDAGILRSKPNIHWKKDRGTDVESAPWYDLGLEYGGKQGDRINDHHLTLAEKKAARDKV